MILPGFDLGWLWMLSARELLIFSSSSAAPAGNQSIEDNRVFTVAEGAIVVNPAAGQSEREIGQNVSRELRVQLEALSMSFDSSVDR